MNITTLKPRYFKFVRELCEAAGTPELYVPVTKIFTICEGIGDTEVDAKETTTTTVDMNKLPEGEIDELKGDLSKTAEADNKLTQAKQDLAASLTSDGDAAEIKDKIQAYNDANLSKGQQVAEMTKKLNAASAAAEQPNANA